MPPSGTDNQLFRLGDELLLRMPRIDWAADSAEWEHTWLPRLEPHLSLPIPAPQALGRPGEGYPFHWTVVRWIAGEGPTEHNIDVDEWAKSLGEFVRATRQIPGMGAPVKTQGRGAPLPALDEWVRTWTARADTSQIDPSAVLAVWEDALSAPAWEGEPAWFHADLHDGNLLVRDGLLAAVIDWGTAGRGDPAVELNAMWGYVPTEGAALYREAVGLDEAAYRRGRGFALAPSISAFTYYRDTDPTTSRESLETVRQLIDSL